MREMGFPFGGAEAAVKEYLGRAGFTFNNANRPDQDAKVKTRLIAFCTHSCQSTVEALVALAGERETSNPGFMKQVEALPHKALIEGVRNLDIHGRPIPACDPGVDSMMMVSGKKPMQISSSHGVAVTMQLGQGGKPKVRNTPKDVKHGKFTPGDALSFVCKGGDLYVCDAE